MYAPADHDEVTTLLRYLEQQLDALRAAPLGLTETQSRETPCRSTLSIAGLIKHVTYGMRGVTLRWSGAVLPSAEDSFADYLASFTPAPDESTVSLLDAFGAARVDYLAAVAATDPDAMTSEPPAPWHGRYAEQPTRARFQLTHQIEEMARHAGHADILREQLDGESVPRLVLTLEGSPRNDFFEPYRAAPGTIGATADDARSR